MHLLPRIPVALEIARAAGPAPLSPLKLICSSCPEEALLISLSLHLRSHSSAHLGAGTFTGILCVNLHLLMSFSRKVTLSFDVEVAGRGQARVLCNHIFSYLKVKNCDFSPFAKIF